MLSQGQVVPPSGSMAIRTFGLCASAFQVLNVPGRCIGTLSQSQPRYTGISTWSSRVSAVRWSQNSSRV